MKRNGTLLNQKYRALLVSTLAMTASTYLSSILDGIMVGQILGTVELYAINLTTSVVFLRSIPIAMFTLAATRSRSSTKANVTKSPPTRCLLSLSGEASSLQRSFSARLRC